MIKRINNDESIQAAIDAANAGDTIEVNHGIYYENVYVNKQLTLRGIGTPVVDAGRNGNAITLEADGIVLEGFAVANSIYPDAGIKVISDYNILRGNNASKNSTGIYLCGASVNTIFNNTISDNDWDGIWVNHPNNRNMMIKNTIVNNGSDGIRMSTSNNGTLRNNTVNNNGYNGIRLTNSNSIVFRDNNVCRNKTHGLLLYASGNNTVRDNIIRANYINIKIQDPPIRNVLSNNEM